MHSTADSDLCRMTATEAKILLDQGHLSVTHYAEALLRRIQERDQITRAWVHLHRDQVLSQARQLDDTPITERGPLHGIPIAVKDIFLTKDMPTQYNSRIFESQTPIGMDANCVATLRAAGALLFGKTTTTEFAATKQGGWFQNQTSNCHDNQRTPGGSSSGSGCAVADFQVPLALGTQTAGSMIRPGSFNGCYAFKPTWGLISREGVAQYSTTCDTIGFFSRCVQDLELVLSKAFLIKDDLPVPQTRFDVSKARIAFCKSPVWSRAGPGTRNAWSQAQRILRDAGATVQDLELPDEFDRVGQWHRIVIAAEGEASFLGQYSQNPDLLHPELANLVTNSNGITRSEVLEAYDGCARLRPIWDSISRGYDAVITPSVIDEAPIGRETGSPAFCEMWSVLHAPMLNIPGFAGEHGLPIGLATVGPRYGDRQVLHIARTIGELFGKYGNSNTRQLDDINDMLLSR